MGDLVQLFSTSLVQFNTGGFRELLFLECYSPLGRVLAARILQLKPHQSPGAAGKILKALGAAALVDRWDKVNASPVKDK